MAASKTHDGDRTVAANRKALYDFHIEERLEAGMVLTGSEIKSVRAGQISLQEAYAQIDRGEAWLLGSHIAPYEHAGYAGHEPLRRRKLLLHAKEIARLAFELKTAGMTLVPLRVYLKNGRAKLELGVAKGKKQHDKRQAIREKDDVRQMARSAARVGRE
ncbi:MAG: SsrA-binding protein SmpB [Anaerolineae bacterium]|nr:SsrA-binding protein SmpB [Ardenticatenia bacterium]MBK8541268.1 SsrA-binding protein SmpB [Ardenticatenia bacterium]HQZ71732.1 SsrA-binding protein SmpB [Anaerolineae bacterium]